MSSTPEREAIEQGWYYVIEPDPPPGGVRVISAPGGCLLTRRQHGFPGRHVVDAPHKTHVERLRYAAALSATVLDQDAVYRAGDVLTAASRHELTPTAPAASPLPSPLSSSGAPRVLFFESLMNSEMPHNDKELSQGVLHLASALTAAGGVPVFANVKMSITGAERPVSGLESLEAALAEPVDLVCITLLEGYWEGVESLIRAIRELGCRAHIAVGGVMPTLAPEHVSAHLDGVSFVCRGAGEPLLPALAHVGLASTIDAPFSEEQIATLLGLNGLIARDLAGGRLITARCDRVVQVGDLDRTPLDLSLLTARHLEDGVELSTSRGCVHKCTFCSIIGREQYQARSAENVIELLGRYALRYAEMFEGPIPSNAWRVHISDDDFACDPERAAAFFRALPDTPFRLSSVQVSVADLFVRTTKGLSTQLHPELWDAIQPGLFADAGRSFPQRDFVQDHRSRRWSSFLQLGVETFSPRELLRLGKGYRLEHIRAVAIACADKGIHWDAYFILSNADTQADDLVDSLMEIVRLKLRFPTHFHIRFPIVPRLVSYLPAATHRRHVRQGRSDVHVLRDRLQQPGFPEYDYPLVQLDRCQDPWVEAALPEDQGQGSFFDDADYYSASLRSLEGTWRARAATEPGGSS